MKWYCPEPSTQPVLGYMVFQQDYRGFALHHRDLSIDTHAACERLGHPVRLPIRDIPKESIVRHVKPNELIAG